MLSMGQSTINHHAINSYGNDTRGSSSLVSTVDADPSCFFGDGRGIRKIHKVVVSFGDAHTWWWMWITNMVP